MALSYKARRRLSLLVLIVGLPAYVVVAVTILSTMDRLPHWLELPVYIFLGVAWAFPLKFVFLGVGKADPDAPQEANEEN